MTWLSPSGQRLPSPSEADEEGLVAVGGSLDTEILLEAYAKGIFPWYEEGWPVLWWSPDPRMVLFPEKFRENKSFRQWMRRHPDYYVTRNRAFDRVIEYCAS
ncbi:MAG: leucyl/phenylalanyl-tRNA--protein transferase, partial [Chlorobi bacterium]|nr:leucyl/phenylalanyl-tRNA--protein transferase [Chlorobiota bacterium]